MTIITPELRRAALAEMRNPVGAYDKIEPDGSHPLSWILKGDSAVMRNNRLLARDQDPSMPPRGAEREIQYGDQEKAPLDADDCVQFIQMLLKRLPPDQHDELIAKLADLIQQAHGGVNGDGIIPPNGGPDRAFRSRRSGARDSRRPAQDSAVAVLNAKSFARRWPETANIEIWNGWRR